MVKQTFVWCSDFRKAVKLPQICSGFSEIRTCGLIHRRSGYPVGWQKVFEPHGLKLYGRFKASHWRCPKSIYNGSPHIFPNVRAAWSVTAQIANCHPTESCIISPNVQTDRHSHTQAYIERIWGRLDVSTLDSAHVGPPDPTNMCPCPHPGPNPRHSTALHSTSSLPLRP